MKKKLYYFLVSGVLTSQLILPSTVSHAAEINYNLNDNISSKIGIPRSVQTWTYNPSKLSQYIIGNSLALFNSGLPELEDNDYNLDLSIVTFSDYFNDSLANLNVTAVYSDGSMIHQNIKRNSTTISIKTNNLKKIIISGFLVADKGREFYNNIIEINQVNY